MQTENGTNRSGVSEPDAPKRSKEATKSLRWGICALVTGVVLIISGAFIPKVFNSLILSQAKKGAYLTPENEKYWDGIPGYLDIGIYWNQYFYNCTNAMDVSCFITTITSVATVPLSYTTLADRR